MLRKEPKLGMGHNADDDGELENGGMPGEADSPAATDSTWEPAVTPDIDQVGLDPAGDQQPASAAPPRSMVPGEHMVRGRLRRALEGDRLQGSPSDEEIDPEIPPLPRSVPADRGHGDPVVARNGGFVESRDRPLRGAAWALAGSAIVIAGLGWWLYEDSMKAPENAEVPLIVAEEGPEKVRPENEGGMEVPNQDITIYNQIEGAAPDSDTEVLLDQPEEPIKPPLDEPAADPSADGAMTTDDGEIPVVDAPSLDGTGAVTPEATEPAAGADLSPSEAAEVATDTAAADAEPGQTALAGAFRVQLAAVKTADGAQGLWSKLEKKYPEQLAPLDLHVQKVERDGGVFYRVQAGPFTDRAAAASTCAALKKRSQDCLVVNP